MKQKTAMMLMLESLKLKQKVYQESGMLNEATALQTSIEDAEQLLEKEEEQIIDAYKQIPFKNFLGPRQYYKQTYLEESKQ